MKRKNEYCGIKTLKTLREARNKNKVARDAAMARCCDASQKLLELFSIKAAVKELRHMLSPLVELYCFFARRKG